MSGGSGSGDDGEDVASSSAMSDWRKHENRGCGRQCVGVCAWKLIIVN